MALTQTKKISKEATKKLPAGAEVVSTSKTVEVEEIENGFLVTTREEIKYRKKGQEYHDWMNNTTKYYSKEDPFVETDKQLADIFS